MVACGLTQGTAISLYFLSLVPPNRLLTVCPNSESLINFYGARVPSPDDGRAHERGDLHLGGKPAHVQRVRGRVGQVLGH